MALAFFVNVMCPLSNMAQKNSPTMSGAVSYKEVMITS